MTRSIQTGRGVGICAAWILVLAVTGVLVGTGAWWAPLAKGEPPTEAKQKPKSKKPASTKRRPGTDATQPKESDQDQRTADGGSNRPNIEYETVELANGQKVKVEKWGDTFEAYEYRPPIDLNDSRVEEVIWYKDLGGGRGGGGGPKGLAVDSYGGALYWAHSSGRPTDGKIIRSTLDGKDVTYLIEGLSRPQDLVLDIEHQKMYWLERNQQSGSLKTAAFNGSGLKSLVEGLNDPSALAIDARQGFLYYAERPSRIVRVKTDGTAEQEILNTKDISDLRFFRGMQWSSMEQVLYFMSPVGAVQRSTPGVVTTEHITNLNLRTDAGNFAIDPDNRFIIAPDLGYGQLIRHKLEGPEREVIVTEPPPMTLAFKTLGTIVALDESRGMVYFTGNHPEGGQPYATINRLKLPPPLKHSLLPAPPWIDSFSPKVVHAGGTLNVTGKYLESTKFVTFVDDSTCEHQTAKFYSDGDNILNITIPKLSEACRNPLIIIETPSGVTMTLTSDLKVLKPSSQYVHDRLTSHSLPQFWLSHETSHAIKIESSVIFVNSETHFQAGAHGYNTVFVKNGCLARIQNQRNGVLYHEPFVRMTTIQAQDPTLKVHAVPAIRPSFVDELLTYQ